jgi:hypothetical protein
LILSGLIHPDRSVALRLPQPVSGLHVVLAAVDVYQMFNADAITIQGFVYNVIIPVTRDSPYIRAFCLMLLNAVLGMFEVTAQALASHYFPINIF